MYKKHSLAFEYLALEGVAPLDAIEAAAAAQFDGVGIRVAAPLGVTLAHPVIGDAALIRKIRERSKAAGVYILDVDTLVISPQTGMADFRPMVEVAAEIEARYIQVVDEEPDRARAVDLLGELCDTAASLAPRAQIALEFMRWRSVADLPIALQTIAAAGRANAHVVLDTLHLHRSGGTAGDVAAAKDAISYVQICDTKGPTPPDGAGLIAEARKHRLMPGKGDIPLADILRALPEDMPISLETPGPVEPGASAIERARAAAKEFTAFLDTCDL